VSIPIFSFKYSTKQDIHYALEVIKVARDKIKGTFVERKLTPSLNRIVLDLEEMVK